MKIVAEATLEHLDLCGWRQAYGNSRSPIMTADDFADLLGASWRC